MKRSSFCLVVTIIVLLNNYTILQSVPHISELNLPEDGILNFTGLAKKYGLHCEEHDVTTADGYVLKLFHIPGNKNQTIFLMHGILDAADAFMLRGNSSLVMALAQHGFDVWAGNARGSRYSRRHVSLDPNRDKIFWNFSFHEIGYYDLPAMIDYILDKNNISSLSAVGHSQGNQVFWVLGSTRPEFNDKIKVMIALAPICYLHNVIPPVAGLVAMGPLINRFLLAINQEEVFGDLSLARKLMELICLQGINGYKMCIERGLFTLTGSDPDELEPDFFPIAISHYPTGTSRKNAVHCLQVAQRKEFVRYDYGVINNVAIYNTTDPPNYNLTKITMKVALFAGKNDKLSALRDVRILKKKLLNVVEYRVMAHEQFNHLDFVWGKNMEKYLFPYLFKLLKTYN